jgi:hypothetical protein
MKRAQSEVVIAGQIDGRRTHMPAALRDHVLARDQRRCRKCGHARELEVHHIRAVCEGGMHVAGNLVTLCGLCHDEETFLRLFDLPFDKWLTLPPARALVRLWHMEWPWEEPAALFKLKVDAATARLRAGEAE